MHRTLFPKHKEAHRSVRVEVLSSLPSLTIVRTLDLSAEEWTFLTPRLPRQFQTGEEITITFTPMELEYLQGKRDLET